MHGRLDFELGQDQIASNASGKFFEERCLFDGGRNKGREKMKGSKYTSKSGTVTVIGYIAALSKACRVVGPVAIH